MADFTIISETRPLPLPGHIEYTQGRINTRLHMRAGKVQIATANLTAGFDGVRDLGIIYGGNNIAYGADAADVAAWLVLVNAALTGIATVTENAGVVTVTTIKPLALALAPFVPDAPALDLSAFTILPENEAIPTSLLRPGMGVVWKDRVLRTVQPPLPTSTLDDYVGTCDRASCGPDDLCLRNVGQVDTYYDGQPILVHRFGSFYTRGLPATPPVPVTDGAGVWMGRIPSEAGYYFGADDGGNTRLRIPGANFHGPGTPSDGRGLRAYFVAQ